MATTYQAVVRIKTVNAATSREHSLISLIQQNLPDDAEVHGERDDQGDLLLSVRIVIQAADASEVQVEARDVVVRALERAGLTEQAALLDDIDVRSIS